MALRKTKISKIILFIILLMGIGFWLKSARTNPTTGQLRGTVTLYPIGPACGQISKCSRPASGQQVEVSRLDDSLLAKTTTNSQGMYRFKLPAGSYILKVPPGRYGRGATNISNPVHITI